MFMFSDFLSYQLLVRCLLECSPTRAQYMGIISIDPAGASHHLQIHHILKFVSTYSTIANLHTWAFSHARLLGKTARCSLNHFVVDFENRHLLPQPPRQPRFNPEITVDKQINDRKDIQVSRGRGGSGSEGLRELFEGCVGDA